MNNTSNEGNFKRVWFIVHAGNKAIGGLVVLLQEKVL